MPIYFIKKIKLDFDQNGNTIKEINVEASVIKNEIGTEYNANKKGTATFTENFAIVSWELDKINRNPPLPIVVPRSESKYGY